MSATEQIRPRPEIVSYCRRCARGWFVKEGDYDVVSPRGVMHIGADYGMTACGIDATGKRWWWPL